MHVKANKNLGHLQASFSGNLDLQHKSFCHNCSGFARARFCVCFSPIKAIFRKSKFSYFIAVCGISVFRYFVCLFFVYLHQ